MTGSAMTGFRNISKAILLGIPRGVRQQLKRKCDPEQNDRIAHPKSGCRRGTGRMWMASVVERICT